LLIRKPEISQAFCGLHDRGFGRTGSPAEFVAGAVVVDDQFRQLISGRLLGRYPLRQWAEPVVTVAVLSIRD
jgi:hypothetical protein